MSTDRDTLIRHVRNKLNKLSSRNLLCENDTINVSRQLKESYVFFELEHNCHTKIISYLDNLSDKGYTRLINEILQPKYKVWLEIGQNKYEGYIWWHNEKEIEDLLFDWCCEQNNLFLTTSKFVNYGYEKINE